MSFLAYDMHASSSTSWHHSISYKNCNCCVVHDQPKKLEEIVKRGQSEETVAVVESGKWNAT